jgi:hypothetical protein
MILSLRSLRNPIFHSLGRRPLRYRNLVLRNLLSMFRETVEDHYSVLQSGEALATNRTAALS